MSLTPRGEVESQRSEVRGLCSDPPSSTSRSAGLVSNGAKSPGSTDLPL